MKNKTILIISPEKWGTNFVSKHHYANYLSKNNTVYFLNPPSLFSKKSIGTINCKSTCPNPKLTILDYTNLIPKLNQLPKTLQNLTYKKQAKQIQAILNIQEFDIVWSFDPYRFWKLKNFSAKKYIYHCVDVHRAKYEMKCADNADLTILVSNFFLEKFSSYKNQLVTGHGSHLLDGVKKTISVPGSSRHKVGLIGNFFSTNIDYDQVIEIAKSTVTSADLILIGPKEPNNLGGSSTSVIEDKISTLNKFDHVFFIGAVPADDLNSYISLMDIHLILYKDFTRNINPHKLIQYLASGKVVMTSPIFDSKVYPENSIFQLEGNNAGTALINLIKNLSFWNSDQLKNIRIAYAKTNSYNNKILEINKLLYP